jgi:hypothetical protein
MPAAAREVGFGGGGGAALIPGVENTVSIEIDAKGTENAIGFSLFFDPDQLRFISAEKGSDLQTASLQINRTRAEKGRLGIALGLPAGTSLEAGTRQVVVLRFGAAGGANQADQNGMFLSFGDEPVKRELVDVEANSLQVNFRDISAMGQNPLENERYFVRQQYLDFLNREPDQGGLEYWTAELKKCGAETECVRRRRLDVSAAFFMEKEFQETGFFLYRLYRGSLGRQPGYAEFLAARNQVAPGANAEASKQALAENWVARPDFLSKYPARLSGERFVEALLENVRQVTGVDLTDERESLIADYHANQSRARIVGLMAGNPRLAAAEYNRAFVLTEYFAYLRRDPDKGGYDFWLNVLNNREPHNYRGMVCSFITSKEYQIRFSTAVTSSDEHCGP